VDSKVGSFNPMAFRDRYEEALLGSPQGERGGRRFGRRNSVFSAPRRFVNLMDALRRSIAQDKRSIAPDKKPPRKDNAFRHDAGQPQAGLTMGTYQMIPCIWCWKTSAALGQAYRETDPKSRPIRQTVLSNLLFRPIRSARSA